MGADAPVLARRRFFLVGEPRAGRAQLAAEEVHHALRVMRVREGAEILGLDGCGRAWPLIVRRIQERAGGRRGLASELELEVTGAVFTEPAPGEPGAALPWIEVAVSLPKPGRAEDMVERLTQLGVAAIRPLACEHTEGAARELSPARLERLRRAAAQACKQAQRLWIPELHPIAALARSREGPMRSWCAGAFGALDAHASLADWARERAHASPRPARGSALGLAIGPEGGWSDAEAHGLSGDGLRPVRIGAHVLRIETAAEAALAIAAQAFAGRP